MAAIAGVRTWCQPRLAYDDEQAAAEFLTRAFGLREENRKINPDGSMLVWLAFGKATMMIGRSGPERHNLYSPRETGKPTAEINVGVDDIDAHYRRALEAGVEIDTPLQDAPFGLRHYEAVDPEGHGWHFMKTTPEGLELRLIYTDEQAALEFLTDAFGFKERARIDNHDGSFMAWLGLGDSLVMIGRGPRETTKPTAMCNLFVDGIDTHYRHAVARGARIVSELADMPWGFRTYEALDPEGNRWHVMQES